MPNSSFFLLISIFVIFLYSVSFLFSGHTSKFLQFRNFYRKNFVDYKLNFLKNEKHRYFIFSQNYRYYILCLPFLSLLLTLVIVRFFGKYVSIFYVFTYFYLFMSAALLLRNRKTYKYDVNGVEYRNSLGSIKNINWDDVVKIWVRDNGFTLSTRKNVLAVDIVKPLFHFAVPLPFTAFISCSPLDFQDSKKQIERGMMLFERYARKKLQGRNVLWST